MQDFLKDSWKRATAFHGHECPGLAIGCAMSAIAAEYLGLEAASGDEEIICITETDACCVDAVQALLGCTFGKGNLLLKLRGKHSITVYSRRQGKGCRIVLEADLDTTYPALDKAGRTALLLSEEGKTLFKVAPAPDPALPEAFITKSIVCSSCGERTAEGMTRFLQEKPYCLDCLPKFSRILA